MTSNPVLNITFLLIAFLLTITGSIYGILFPAKVLDSIWGESTFKNATPFTLRIILSAFLAFSLFGLGLSVSKLSKGEFQWRGAPTKYGFPDLFDFSKNNAGSLQQ